MMIPKQKKRSEDYAGGESDFPQEVKDAASPQDSRHAEANYAAISKRQ